MMTSSALDKHLRTNKTGSSQQPGPEITKMRDITRDLHRVMEGWHTTWRTSFQLVRTKDGSPRRRIPIERKAKAGSRAMPTPQIKIIRNSKTATINSSHNTRRRIAACTTKGHRLINQNRNTTTKYETITKVAIRVNSITTNNLSQFIESKHVQREKRNCLNISRSSRIQMMLSLRSSCRKRQPQRLWTLK